MTQAAPLPVEIRRASIDDLPVVLDLIASDSLAERKEALGPPLPQAYYDAFAAIEANPDHLLCVAVLDGRVVGTFHLVFIQKLSNRGGRLAQIESVRVEGAQRGRGIGEQMMRWAIDVARRRGCVRLQLTSNTARVHAHRFYERLGFSRSHVGMKLVLDEPA